MEIIGDDKKLRALFSETQSIDAQATPSFTSVWHRARARSLKPRRAFNLSLAAVATLLVLALGSLAVWSMHASRSNKRDEAVANKAMPGSVAPGEVKSPEKKIDEDVKTANNASQNPIALPVQKTFKPRVRRSLAQTDRQMIASNGTTKVKETTIDNWQSPTAALLSSPTDELFKSLPQLNENANELRSSLPGKSNEKEK